MPQHTTVSDEISGYLAADHTIRRVSPLHRAATAAAVLARIPFDPRSGYDRGYRLRLRTFVSTTTTGQQGR
ncbi:hypothetical protein Gbro_4890 (plasmid) [Gordonia bronchialis DSM 43247]|uniref:Uncharacterized protein n=1 Tax=Gordonia bronchialis (strain ATCC 25592 / DSM 43247 / BCRC 13721 / JCM 3198 / KCTC 3076 / NBRC 16047 / NCTC 10667) TaxID=526226 RepID=D0LFF4_GORB4|nr:hypothetical protein [Gordonia bronchialis]ACY24003.1 hypothetical protein Gbro_4890 [Gordonia bronchialis DSM 43247]MCC3326025.1 hypothetical protein [Gordonia bronchialis]QGS27327.1 hypothetical protein FOB84_24405 [Gordonia bronchialis]STS10837.1 Uncharacterised protein [Gordonia bronchialis]